MRLVDLEPRWCVGHRQDSIDDTRNYRGMGISFLCPQHKNHRLVIMFSNPIDGLSPAVGFNHLWDRIGDSFESISVRPSIDASNNHYDLDGFMTPCWHGCINSGTIV